MKRIHWSLRDPDVAKGTEQEILNEFRRVRDKIKTSGISFIKEGRHG